MISDPIFQRDSKGKVRSWQFEVDGARWRTISGLVDGEKVVTGWTECVPKSQDTAEEQALFEAHAEEKKKLKRKYHRSIENVSIIRGAGVLPMLAESYEKWRGPCASQPKLDGIRCLANRHGLWTRSFEQIVSCPHISTALASFFKKFPNHVLDGELYNHALHDDFNEISSLIKRPNADAEAWAKSADIVEYHIYDIATLGSDDFSKRCLFLMAHLPDDPVIVNVDTNWHQDEASLDAAYMEYLNKGYEGQMLRFVGPYEGKRSETLLKRKEFIDQEFPFLGFEIANGSWNGIPKTVKIQLPNGKTCAPTIKASKNYCKSLIGKTFDTVTVRFQGWTPDGSLRFARAVALHEGARW
jgi:DNA ligase-1